MKIQLDGTNTLNKGAELMLYAMVEQVEKQHPNAKVYYNCNDAKEKYFRIESPLIIKKRFGLKYGRYPFAILSRLQLPHTFFSSKYPLKNIDLVLDGAGFQFSDQWNYSKKRLNALEHYYKKLKSYGTKIILLPQAFGPFETEEGKRAVKIINTYVDVIIAREKVSYEMVIKAGADANKVWIYPDFTLLVKGSYPEEYDKMQNGICIIPNEKMVTHTSSGSKSYLNFMVKVIVELQESDKKVFLLNHEGEGDLKLCHIINEQLKSPIPIVSGLNGKEVKGVIGKSHMVVSSRFHGVASALSQGVPCLATSWNHKYEMLFNDYDQKDKILDLEGTWETESVKIKNMLSSIPEISKVLREKKKVLNAKISEMWNKIWLLN